MVYYADNLGSSFGLSLGCFENLLVAEVLEISSFVAYNLQHSMRWWMSSKTMLTLEMMTNRRITIRQGVVVEMLFVPMLAFGN